MTRRLVVFVLVMVLFAGCVTGPFSPNATTPNETTQAASPSQSNTDTPQEGSPSGSTATSPSDDPADPVSSNNPWGERTLTVAIETEPDNDRQFRPMVEEALAYWEEHSEQYAGYPIEYTLEPNAQNPDLVISFVSSIDDCGESRGVQGCAKKIEHPSDFDRPAKVQIQNEYTDPSTRQLIIHELGHTLGLGHGDPPEQIMAATSDLTKLPQPDVTERELPWNHSTLTVAVDTSNVPFHEQGTVDEQINAALDYYAEGADGKVPDRVEFERVSDAENADIKINFSDPSPCGIDHGSCSRPKGYDSDTDSALERYVRVNITLTKVDPKAVAWHVGVRLGEGAFGFDQPNDYPPPLQGHKSTEFQRSRWWE